jgi:hypothetical protein
VRDDRRVSRRAFDGLTPADDAAHARWVVEELAASMGVSSVVPARFEAYARLLHPLPGDQRWAEVAPTFTGHGLERYEYPYADQLLAVEGSLDAAIVDALVGVLANATSKPDCCHFGLWKGWGWLHAGSSSLYAVDRSRGPLARLRSARELQRVRRQHQLVMQDVHEFAAACPVPPGCGDRGMLLFDGPIGAVDAIGYDALGQGVLSRQSPQWWWPSDDMWFVATEIDYPWTYVAGPDGLIKAVLALNDLESVRIDRDELW